MSKHTLPGGEAAIAHSRLERARTEEDQAWAEFNDPHPSTRYEHLYKRACRAAERRFEAELALNSAGLAAAA